MNNFSFSGFQGTNVIGRAMEFEWAPGAGLGDKARIDLLQVVPAANQLSAIAFPTNNATRFTGELTLGGDDLTACRFPGIDLRRMGWQITGREKRLLLSFGYDPHVSAGPDFAPVLGFTEQPALQPGALGDTYRFCIDGATENLLGFEAELTSTNASVLRFAIVRTGPANSFLRKVLETHQAWNAARQLMPEFTIQFSKGNIVVNNETLDHVHVIELSGQLLAEQIAALGQPDLPAELVQLPAWTGKHLLDHHRNQRFEGLLHGRTIEIATLVCHPGHYRDLQLS